MDGTQQPECGDCEEPLISLRDLAAALGIPLKRVEELAGVLQLKAQFKEDPAGVQVRALGAFAIRQLCATEALQAYGFAPLGNQFADPTNPVTAKLAQHEIERRYAALHTRRDIVNQRIERLRAMQLALRREMH